MEEYGCQLVASCSIFFLVGSFRTLQSSIIQFFESVEDRSSSRPCQLLEYYRTNYSFVVVIVQPESDRLGRTDYSGKYRVFSLEVSNSFRPDFGVRERAHRRASVGYRSR